MSTKENNQASAKPFRFSPRVWIGLAIAVASLAFIFQNREITVTQILIFQIKAPQWITLLTIFLVGMGTAWLLSRPRK